MQQGGTHEAGGFLITYISLVDRSVAGRREEEWWFGESRNSKYQIPKRARKVRFNSSSTNYFDNEYSEIKGSSSNFLYNKCGNL